MKKWNEDKKAARTWGIVVGITLSVALSQVAGAQTERTVAIMPTQYFSADAESAARITLGLAQQFEPKGYQVISEEQSQSTTRSMSLEPNRHYADKVALEFGRRLGATLVAYPRLLVLGATTLGEGAQGGAAVPSAVLHLRVLNTRTGRPVFFRQIAHEFGSSPSIPLDYTLSQQVASAAADEVMQRYFVRVAGSREELGRPR